MKLEDLTQGYQDLLVWQKSMQLVKEIHTLTKLLPKEEMYALCNQMHRAVISIPSNIAEGHSRNSDKELIQFLYIARGSKAELETQLNIGVMLEYFSESDIARSVELCNEVGRMLNSFIAKLKS